MMKSFAAFFEELGKKSIWVNRFQQLDTEIVQIKERDTKVSGTMFPDRTKFSAEGLRASSKNGLEASIL